MEEIVESSRKLVLLYERFYNENPDFSEENVKRKAVAMVYLLWEHSVFLPMLTSFQLSDGNPSKVWSNDIQNLFQDCSVIAENNPEWKLEESNSWSIQFADLIGIVVSYYSFENDTKFMEDVATILFLRKRSLVNATINDIVHSKYVSCDYNKVSVIMNLLDYLDVLRDYICGIGKYFGVVHNIDEQIDNILENVELQLTLKNK